ncbi:MAG: alpha/beta hydrolase [Alphaproteobacteria bacterium]|nr:alpha/beta hydrolase [Alphaproteobacteria bacterium]
MKLYMYVFAALAVLMAANGVCFAADGESSWDKVFEKSDLVDVRKVHFTNRFGIELTGDLYEPKNRGEEKMGAIAVSGPFGAVKEQSSGLYAQELAKRGFVALAFDPSFTGESGGNVRNVASPDINTDDFSAAVDYLTTLPEVDAEKIGILGICGFGGFGLNAAAQDTRIKATVASTMYDMTRVSAKGYNDSMNEEDLYHLRESLNAERTKDYQNGTFEGAPGLPEKLTGDEPQFVKDYFDYYKTPRGFHERSINSNGHWNTTSALSLITQPILAYADTIKNAVLIVHGEKAHSRYFGEDAFKKLKGSNKELLIVEGANHVDLYDNMQKIPFDKIENFYQTYLK